jgi:hypothetical protein
VTVPTDPLILELVLDHGLRTYMIPWGFSLTRVTHLSWLGVEREIEGLPAGVHMRIPSWDEDGTIGVRIISDAISEPVRVDGHIECLSGGPEVIRLYGHSRRLRRSTVAPTMESS